MNAFGMNYTPKRYYIVRNQHRINDIEYCLSFIPDVIDHTTDSTALTTTSMVLWIECEYGMIYGDDRL